MPSKSLKNTIRQIPPKWAGALLFVFLFLGISIFAIYRYYTFKDIRSDNLQQILAGVNRNTQQYLANIHTLNLALSNAVDNSGKIKNFDSIAKPLHGANTWVKALQLVPNGVISDVYPKRGNAKVIGIDLFKSKNPLTIIEANKAIKAKSIFFQGPVKLTQGGFGVVGRTPIYRNEKFWGFAATVVDLDVFLKGIGLVNPAHGKSHFQFSKINPITHKEDFFMPAIAHFNEREIASVNVLEGDWKIYVVGLPTSIILWAALAPVLLGFVLAVICGCLATRLLVKQLQLKNRFIEQSSKMALAERKYKTIFDQASVGIARVNSTSGYFVEVNNSLCEFFGYAESELQQMKIKSLIYDEDVNHNSALFKQMLAGNFGEFVAEHRCKRKDGKLVWAKISVKAMWHHVDEEKFHLLILEDITVTKEAEELLVRERQHLENIVNSLEGIVFETNMADYSSTFMANGIEQLLGYPVSRWYNEPGFFLTIVHEDDLPFTLSYLQTEMQEDASHDVELRLAHADGSTVWVKEIITIEFKDGKPLTMRGIMINITERKAAEEALTKSFELVNEQNKRLLNFSHIVSHNLRSHASNIQGVSSLIHMAKDDDDREEMIELLKRVGDNLNETLVNLNNVVNIQTAVDVPIEPLNLYAFIIHTVDTLRTQILSKKATIINKVDVDFEVNFNRAYLESVLLNLISNALKYGHPDRNPVITLRTITQDGKSVLKVTDNGIGIDMAKHGDKIFGLYQTFHGNSDARGFGLFITKNQVDAMGGSIQLQSAINQGSSFCIAFK